MKKKYVLILSILSLLIPLFMFLFLTRLETCSWIYNDKDYIFDILGIFLIDMIVIFPFSIITFFLLYIKRNVIKTINNNKIISFKFDIIYLIGGIIIFSFFLTYFTVPIHFIGSVDKLDNVHILYLANGTVNIFRFVLTHIDLVLLIRNVFIISYPLLGFIIYIIFIFTNLKEFKKLEDTNIYHLNKKNKYQYMLNSFFPVAIITSLYFAQSVAVGCEPILFIIPIIIILVAFELIRIVLFLIFKPFSIKDFIILLVSDIIFATLLSVILFSIFNFYQFFMDGMTLITFIILAIYLYIYDKKLDQFPIFEKVNN